MSLVADDLVYENVSLPTIRGKRRFEKGADDANAQPFNGKALAEFCTVVMHNTVPLAPGAVASRAIGASITCP